MSEMVERVARAITGHCYVHPDVNDERDCGELDGMPEVTRELYMGAARAAIAAMRAPTSGMALVVDPNDWRAAINAALAEDEA